MDTDLNGEALRAAGNYRENGKSRISDAVALTVAIPEEQDFSWMKQMAGYFFEDMQPVTPKKQKKMEGPSR